MSKRPGAFRLLLWDELVGFYKSNVMIGLWIGLPALAIVTSVFLPGSNNDIPLSTITAGIISSVGGWLAAMMLALNLISERNHHVYDLFLIRPVKRYQLLLSKYLAVIICVILASMVALSLSFVVDIIAGNSISTIFQSEIVHSLVISIAIICIECAAGALVGVTVSGVLVGIILVAVTHNLASLSVIMPVVTKFANTVLMAAFTGTVLTAIFLVLALWMFNRQQF